MPRLTRRCLFVAVPLVGLVLAATLLLAGGLNLKARSDSITVGMPREEVESILGRPELWLNRAGGRGTLLSWVDQFWQVDVRLDRDGRVESVERKPSHSVLRATVGRLVQLPE
jgi:hypothetical protein